MDEKDGIQATEPEEASPDYPPDPVPVDRGRVTFARLIGLLAILTLAFFVVAIVVGVILGFVS